MKRIKKTIAFLLLTALMMTLLSGCETWNNFKKAFIDPPQEMEYRIKIGIFEPQTGRQSYDAEDELTGMELAHELFPKAGGYSIELIYEDNRSNTDVCVEAVQKLADAGCAAILGSVSDTLSMAASNTIKENCIPAISATNTVPILTQTNPYYLRACYINSFDAEGAAKFAYEELKADKCVIILPDNDDYSKDKAEDFDKAFKELCGKEYFDYSFSSEDPQSGEEITNTITKPVVEYIYINGEESAEKIHYTLQQLDKAGYLWIYSPCTGENILDWIYESYDYTFYKEEGSRQQSEESIDDEGRENYGTTSYMIEDTDKYFSWIGTDRWIGIENQAMESYQHYGLLSHVYYTTDFDETISQTEMTEKFLNAYHEKFGADKDPSNEVYLGFDAYMIVYQGLCDSIDYSFASREENTDEEHSSELSDLEYSRLVLFDSEGNFNRSLLTRKLYQIKNMAGATGTITIDSNGDPTKEIIIEGFNGYSFNPVHIVQPSNLVSDDEQ